MSTMLDPAVVDRFEAFYSHYCPDRLPFVTVVLTSYKGREDALMDKLKKQYGPWPVEGVPEVLPKGSQPASRAPSEAAAPQQSSAAQQPTSMGYVPPSPAGSVPASAKAPSVHSTPAQRSLPPASRQSSVRSAAKPSASATPAAPAAPPSNAGSQQGSAKGSVAPSVRTGGSQRAPSVQAQEPEEEGRDLVSEAGSVVRSLLGFGSRKSSRHSDAPQSEGAATAQQQQSSHRAPPSVQAPRAAPPTPSETHRSAAAPSAPASHQQRSMGGTAPHYSAAPSSTGAAPVEVDPEAQLVAGLRAELAQREARLHELQAEVHRASEEAHNAPLSPEGERMQGEVAAMRSARDANAEAIEARARHISQLQQQGQMSRGGAGGGSPRGSPGGVPKQTHDLIKAAYATLSKQRGVAFEKDGEIAELRRQLAEAQDAILASTRKGFHHDVKLYQARRALATMADDKSARRSQRRAQREAEAEEVSASPEARQQHGRLPAWQPSPQRQPSHQEAVAAGQGYSASPHYPQAPEASPRYAVPAMDSIVLGDSTPPALDTSAPYPSPSAYTRHYSRSGQRDNRLLTPREYRELS